ncbi:MAG: hypothetical protein FWF53_09310 [Candidatus Azobacteroides sp.]|nr:hypothetical protein [Candidatus Azobacteroides sp.]
MGTTGQFFSNSLPINVQVLFGRKYVQRYEPDTQNTVKMKGEDIVRLFSQLYDKWKECGDTAGIGFDDGEKRFFESPGRR